MVNPDADGRGWTGDAAKEPGRSRERHSPARSHDGHWVQLTPRPFTALNRMLALGADQKGFSGHRPNGHYRRDERTNTTVLTSAQK